MMILFIRYVTIDTMLNQNKALVQWYPEGGFVPWLFKDPMEYGFWNNQDNHK